MTARGKLLLFLLLSMLIAGSFSPILSNRAKAADESGAFNLVTSPLPISLNGVPGSTLTTDIRIKNGGTATEKLKVTLMKFSAYGEEGKPAIADREEGDTYFDWVKFTPSVFDAPPNEWKSIKMTITLPKTAAFGYYYAAAFSRATIQTPASRQNVILGSTAVLVLVEAKVGNVKREAKLVSFSANRGSYEFLPTVFSIKVRNTGNIHLVPTGNIIISRGKKEVSRLSVNTASGNVLPNSNRIFTAQWNDGFPRYKEKEENGKIVLDKNGRPQVALEWDANKITHLRIGKYTARLLMVYDDGTRDVPLEATVSFWVIPWRLIGATIAILVVPAGLVYLIMRRRMRRQMRRAGRRV